MSAADRAGLSPWTPAATSVWFIKTTQHHPGMRVNISTHVGLTSIYTYMHCLMDRIVENIILAKHKSSLKIQICPV